MTPQTCAELNAFVRKGGKDGDVTQPEFIRFARTVRRAVFNVELRTNSDTDLVVWQEVILSESLLNLSAQEQDAIIAEAARIDAVTEELS